jgi:hypothetical protein
MCEPCGSVCGNPSRAPVQDEKNPLSIPVLLLSTASQTSSLADVTSGIGADGLLCGAERGKADASVGQVLRQILTGAGRQPSVRRHQNRTPGPDTAGSG